MLLSGLLNAFQLRFIFCYALHFLPTLKIKLYPKHILHTGVAGESLQLVKLCVVVSLDHHLRLTLHHQHPPITCIFPNDLEVIAEVLASMLSKYFVKELEW